MQKIFIKYVAVIMTAAIFLILFINGLFTSHTMRNQQYKTFQAKIDQMIHTLENNRMELALLNENLDADYLTRARAAAYVMDRQEDVLMDVSKMQYLLDSGAAAQCRRGEDDAVCRCGETGAQGCCAGRV